ncbi:ABC transporter permease [Acidobacteria bacterium AB60]|nr:ABC transporter permease [Acidobacteria bacterium AB60]
MRARLLQRGRAAAELERELQSHLHDEIDANRAAGMSAEQARIAALRSVGNLALIRDQTHATWSWGSAEAWVRDLRLGMRTLLRAPGFTIIAVLIMGLGIGANVALFTVVRSVLLKPLPFPDSDRLVTLYENETGHRGNPYMPVDAGSFFEWQKAATGVEQMAMVSPFQNYNVSAEGGKLPERIDAGWVSWNFFSTLGVQPALGRGFSASDDRPEASATVILDHRFWKRRYSADPAIVGKTIWLDVQPYTVIGVMPENFQYNGGFGGKTVMAWTPIAHDAPRGLLGAFNDHETIVIARLRKGVSLQALVSQLDPIQKQIKKEHPGPSIHDLVSGHSMLDDEVDHYKTPLYALLAATGCVLLIACMNVSGLLVARASARRKEMAIRAAMGGGRLRLLRERIVESVLISLGGGTVGAMLAAAALLWLRTMRQDINRLENIRFDGVVVLFTLGAVAVCALFSGLLTALSVDDRNLLSVLQEASRSASGGRNRAALRKTLLVVEVCLTVVLLAGAGLLVKSYQRMRTADLGIPVDNTLTMKISLPEASYKKQAQVVAFFELLIARVRSMPGVQAAGLISKVPGQGWGGDRTGSVTEHPPQDGRGYTDMHMRGADPGYFSAAQIPLFEGRVFRPDERLDRGNVAVISRLAAQRAFPGEDPLGKHIQFSDKERYEVVGVVGDTRWNLSQPPYPTMYIPIYGNDYSVATIFVRSPQAESLALPIQQMIAGLDRDLPVADVITLRDTIGKSTIDSQFDSVLVLGFAVIALVLSAAGLYGVLSYLVTQRTGEIGIRMALGAPRTYVLRSMLIDGLRPALFGLILGLGTSLAAGRLIASMLYETKPYDSGILAAVSALLLLVAAGSCLIPAWRASRLSPMSALRIE